MSSFSAARGDVAVASGDSRPVAVAAVAETARNRRIGAGDGIVFAAADRGTGVPGAVLAATADGRVVAAVRLVPVAPADVRVRAARRIAIAAGNLGESRRHVVLGFR